MEKRDTVYGEDKSWVRTGHAPANMATVSEAALPIVIQAWFETVPASINHCHQHRAVGLKAILSA